MKYKNWGMGGYCPRPAEYACALPKCEFLLGITGDVFINNCLIQTRHEA